MRVVQEAAPYNWYFLRNTVSFYVAYFHFSP